MIQLNPDFSLPSPATCPQRHQAEAMRTALVLLTRRVRTPSQDHDLLTAAQLAWEAARLSSCTRGTIGAGLLLAQVQLTLGHHQAAALTAQRVQALARGTPGAALTCVRALAVGAAAWRRLGQPEAAEHLAALGALVGETIRDPRERALALGVELSTASKHT